MLLAVLKAAPKRKAWTTGFFAYDPDSCKPHHKAKAWEKKKRTRRCG